MPGMTLVLLLAPGRALCPISERIATRMELVRLNHTLWIRKPGTYKWINAGPADGYGTGKGQVHKDYGRR